MRRSASIILMAAVSACHRGSRSPSEVGPRQSAIPPVNSVTGLINAMRDKYVEKWYKSLSFTQVNRYTIGGKEQSSEWVENLSVPGRLRIDFLPLTQKSGLLIDNSRVSTFSAGKRIDTRRLYQSRPLLSSDIYVQATNLSVRRLDSLGIDTTRIRSERLDGKRVFVLGAASGDLTSTQAWFDAESLLLQRFIQSEVRGGKKVTSDLRVTGYTEVAGFPIPEAFVTKRDGVITLREEWTHVKVNTPMPATLFDPAKWASVKISQ